MPHSCIRLAHYTSHRHLKTMTKLHASHTIKTILHTRLFPYLHRSRAGLVRTLNKHGQVALKMLPHQQNSFIGRMINEIQFLQKAYRLFVVCVCSLEIHFSYLWTHAHTQTRAHTGTKIFFHMGKSLALSHLDYKEFLSLFSTTLSLWAVCWPHLTSSLGRHQNKTKHLGCSS